MSCKGKRRRCPRADSGKLLRPRSAPTRCRRRSPVRARAGARTGGWVYFSASVRAAAGRGDSAFFLSCAGKPACPWTERADASLRRESKWRGDRSVPEKVSVLSRYGIPGQPSSCRLPVVVTNEAFLLKGLAQVCSACIFLSPF